MNDWYERSMKALQLTGLAERTQYSYTRDVRLLVEFCGKVSFTNMRRMDYWGLVRKK